MTVRLGDVNRDLVLTPHSLRTEGFKLLVEDSDGKLSAAVTPASQTYRGYVEGVAESRVAATAADGAWSAVVVPTPGERWYIEPSDSSETAAASGPGEHLVYQSDEVDSIPRSCGSSGAPAEQSVGSVAGVADPVPGSATTLRVADIAFDADAEFFRMNGSSVINTVNDIENIMNGVSMIYENELQITYEITTIIVRTGEPDPYSATEHTALLAQFRNEWNANHLGVHRDIAHLMTGRKLDGQVIGTASIGAMCQVCANANGYGLSQSRFSDLLADRVCLTAHEIGHGWGAVHCDGQGGCGLMCSSLDGCPQACDHVDAMNASTIQYAAATLACISTLAPPATFPFCETFDNGINNGAWSYNAASSVSVLARNAPTPPYVLLIDDCCTACTNGPDEIRSSTIPLGDVVDAVAIFYTQHSGGLQSAGSSFVVEYWSAYGNWVELNRIVSDGVNQTAFDRWVHLLPPDAMHDGFRLRFRTESVSTADQWFVDNVSIMRAEPQSSVLRVRHGASGAATGADWDSAFPELSDAITVAACAGEVVDEIWVAQGTHRPDHATRDRSATFRLLNGVEILGGFAGVEESKSDRSPPDNETILSGDIGIEGTAVDNSYHVVTGNGNNATAILDGFTIRDGNATATATDGGGGLRLTSSAASIRDCVFTSNTGKNGGAIQLSSLSGSEFADCEFSENSALISGGAIYVGSSCTARVDRCVLLANQALAFGGAMHSAGGMIDLSNSLVSGNGASSGGAIYNLLGNLFSENNTIYRNSAVGSVGGVLNSNASATIASTILWDNRDASGAVQSSQIAGASVALDYSCVQGLTGSLGGTGNTAVAPQFVDAVGSDGVAGTSDDDLRLLAGSPAINGGDPAVVAQVDTGFDLDRGPRVLCGRIDMGAFEFGLFDFDCDQTIGSRDVAGWSDCLQGPAAPISDPACLAFDGDGNSRIDLSDFARFETCLGSGSTSPACRIQD